MGGRSWAERAERELAAAGGDPAPRDADELTARERDVCDLVAAGATNREVAAALFLSPRTVEHHLRLAYRKLGMRSRSELAARWPG
jgi:DNA-binding CsgD family transcriptional regulator